MLNISVKGNLGVNNYWAAGNINFDSLIDYYMEFFKISIGATNNIEWKAILTKEEDEKSGLITSLNKGGRLILKDLVNFNLVNIQLPQERRENPFDSDLIYWKDDFMLNANTPNVLSGSYYILSKKIVLILKKYRLPNHEFYPIRLSLSKEKYSNDYFLLFIYGSQLNHIDYRKSSYILSKRRPRVVVDQIESNHLITNFEKLKEMRSSYLKNENLILDFKNIVLTVDYDILWGIPNVLLVSELVKKEMEYEDIKGISITPKKSPTYLSKSESQNIS